MLNRSVLMGRIANDLELKQTPNGVYVTSFRIAVDRNYSSNGQKTTDFIKVVAWRQTAEFICNYFSKGRMIAIEGALQTKNYEDKNGSKRTAYEVVIDQAYFADSKQGDNNQASNKPQQKPDFDDFEELESDEADLPF